MNQTDVFDHRTDFEKTCRPILEQLRRQCLIEGIPFFFSACVSNDDEHTEYISDGIMTGSNRITLTDDQIKKHLLVVTGFDVIASRSDIEVIMDEPDAL